MADNVYTPDEEMIEVELSIPEPGTPSYDERQVKGHCVICGKATGDGRRKYCDEHQGAKKLPKATNRTGARKRGNSEKSATNGELAGSLGKLLVIFTLILAWYQLRGRRIPDPNGDIAERIAFSDEESVAIARPLARVINTTDTGIRYGKTLVDNSDLVDATFAMWQWYKRMNETLDAVSQGRAMPIERSNSNGNSGSDAEYSNNSGGYGIPGLDAEYEYESS